MDTDQFRQITQHCVTIFQAVQRAQDMTGAAEQVLTQARNLLTEAGLIYLADVGIAFVTPDASPSTPSHGMASSFAYLQQGYAELVQGLTRLAEALIESDPRQAGELWSLLQQLHPSIEDSTRFVDALIAGASNHFSRGNWAQGRAVLREAIDSPRAKLLLMTSYLDESEEEGWRYLPSEEPDVIDLASYRRVTRLYEESMSTSDSFSQTRTKRQMDTIFWRWALRDLRSELAALVAEIASEPCS